MTASHTEPEAIYEIIVKGSLAAGWSGWFTGFTLRSDEDGNTIMVGAIIDQAELYGILERIRDLGLLLLSVHKVKSPEKSTQPEITLSRSSSSDKL